jgi:hypothetical protein
VITRAVPTGVAQFLRASRHFPAGLSHSGAPRLESRVSSLALSSELNPALRLHFISYFNPALSFGS